MGLFDKGKKLYARKVKEYKKERKFNKETARLAREEAKKERRKQYIKTAKHRESVAGRNARKSASKGKSWSVDTGALNSMLSGSAPMTRTVSVPVRRKTKKKRRVVVRRSAESEPSQRSSLDFTRII